MMENVHRDPTLDSCLGTIQEIQFNDGQIATGRIEWVNDVKSGYKTDMYVLICPQRSISFYKTHVKKINGMKFR